LKDKLVLVLIPTFSQTIEQRICLGIDEVLSKEGAKVLYAPLGYLPGSEESLSQHIWVHSKLSQLKPDIVLAYGGGLAYRSSEEIYQKILAQYVDALIINMGNVVTGIPSVIVDNYRGMFDLMSTIISRRPNDDILYVSGPPNNEDSMLRLDALKAALAEQGRSIEAHQILEGDFTARVAQESFDNYLNSNEHPAKIIVCANDLNAKGVLDCLAEREMSCPDDYWVTGFDDFEYASSMLPGLSTVHYPARDVGKQSALLAKSWLNCKEKPVEQTVVHSFPVLRGTTGDKHPGLGGYDEQLSKQWALIHQRDNNARKLAVIRNFQRHNPLEEILKTASKALADLDVLKLALYIDEVGDDGQSLVTKVNLDGERRSVPARSSVLPKAFYDPNDDFYWLLCPLAMDEERFGYMVAKCSPVTAEFVEFIAPQFTDLLHAEALEKKAENYRVQNELNERMASLGSLVSGVAHEVNTPIGTGKLAASSLLGSLNTVKRQMDDNKLTKQGFDQFVSESEEYSSIIFQSLDRAAELISNFKLVSVDQSAEDVREFDLGEYIQSVLISLKHQLKGLEIELETDLADGVIINAPAGAVAQVITNLFMNSIKHGLENGHRAGSISIKLIRQKNSFSLAISDNGRGATQDILNHIFDPFFTTSRGAGGSGLGMHIVFNIVTQKLNWSIQLESEPEKGFKATLSPKTS
jgi:signal transduction histidine kinase/DNA-binding LacI/PurR family transcriptional regulator